MYNVYVVRYIYVYAAVSSQVTGWRQWQRQQRYVSIVRNLCVKNTSHACLLPFDIHIYGMFTENMEARQNQKYEIKQKQSKG